MKLVAASLLAFVVASVPTRSLAAPAPQAGELGALLELLRLAPDVLAGSEPPGDRIATFVDVAAQLAAVGVDAPASRDDRELLGRFARATLGLQYPLILRFDVGAAEWRSVLGFELFDVDQGLSVHGTWNGRVGWVTVLRGRFDEDALRAAWAGDTYQALDLDGVAVAERRRREQTAEYWTRLPDGTVVVATELDGMLAALDVVADSAPSLAERPEVATLLESAQTDLASAVLLPGAALDRLPSSSAELHPRLRPSEVEAILTAVEEAGEMPPVRLALLGTTPGGPVAPSLSRGDEPTPTPEPQVGPEGRFAIALLMEDEAATEDAAGVVERRLETVPSLVNAVPYAESYPERSIDVAAGAPVVLIELVPPDVRDWQIRIALNDLLFLYW